MESNPVTTQKDENNLLGSSKKDASLSQELPPNRLKLSLILGFINFAIFYCLESSQALQYESNISPRAFNVLLTVFAIPNLLLPFTDHLIINQNRMMYGFFLYVLVLFMGQIIISLGAIYDTLWMMILGHFFLGFGFETLVYNEGLLFSHFLQVQSESHKTSFSHFSLHFITARLGGFVNMLICTLVYYYGRRTIYIGPVVASLFLFAAVLLVLDTMLIDRKHFKRLSDDRHIFYSRGKRPDLREALTTVFRFANARLMLIANSLVNGFFFSFLLNSNSLLSRFSSITFERSSLILFALYGSLLLFSVIAGSMFQQNRLSNKTLILILNVAVTLLLITSALLALSSFKLVLPVVIILLIIQSMSFVAFNFVMVTVQRLYFAGEKCKEEIFRIFSFGVFLVFGLVCFFLAFFFNVFGLFLFYPTAMLGSLVCTIWLSVNIKQKIR